MELDSQIRAKMDGNSGHIDALEESTDFGAIVNTPEFVDKTLLIKVLVPHKYRRIVLSAPQGFGKSVNMNMVKRFLEIEVDERGVPKPIEETANYRLFKDNEEKLAICNDVVFFRKHFGQHPVVFIDLEPFRTVDSYRSMISKFREILSNTYGEHKYLLHADDLHINKKYFEDHITANENVKLGHSDFNFLSRLLRNHFKKKVCIIVDEYDSLISALITNEIEDGSSEEIIHFLHQRLRSLLSSLGESSSNADHLFFSGRSKMAGVALLSGTGLYRDDYYLEYFPFLHDHDFVRFYGLTGDELEVLLHKFHISDKLQEVRRWYGYKLNEDLTIYNTHSIKNYLKTKKIKNYRTNGDIIENLKNLVLFDNFESKFKTLLRHDESFIFRNPFDIKPEHLTRLIQLIKSPSVKPERHDLDLFLHYLCDGGGYFNFTEHRSKIRLEVPNVEIGTELADNIYSVLFYKMKYNFEPLRIIAFCNALQLLEGKEKNTFVNFAKSVADLFSRVSFPKSESEFHGPFYTFLRNFSRHFVVDGEIYTPRGEMWRSHILIVGPDGTAIIVELNVGECTAKDGLEKIFCRSSYSLLDTDENRERIRKDKIYMGVHLSCERKVTVCYLVNSTDLNESIEVSSC